MLKYIKVDENNKDLAIGLQAEIFSHERSPKQIEQGIKTGNPINYIVYNDQKPVGIVGYYKDANYPEHLFINWFGVVQSERRKGFGKSIMQWLIGQCKNTSAKYLTTYTEKIENYASVKMYESLGFEIRNYANQDDISKFAKLGKPNDYVVCCYKLKNCEPIQFEKMYLKVYDDLIEME